MRTSMSSSKLLSLEGSTFVCDKIFSIAENSRKISRSEGLKKCVNSLIATINQFNKIQPDDYLFKFSEQEVSVSELVIPQELSFLLIPLSIRLNPNDLKTKDIKVIPQYGTDNNEIPMSLLDFKCEIENFRRYFKLSGAEDLVKVMDVRKNVSLFDCLDSLCVVQKNKTFEYGMVHYFRDAFWPTFVQADSIKSLLEDNFFNDNCLSICKDFLFNLHFG